MNAHAKFSPSSAARWTKCTISMDLHKQEEGKSSFYAQEGTVCHEIAAQQLERLYNDKSSPKLDQYLGKKVKGIEIKEEHIDAIQDYIDIILGITVNASKFHIEIEHSGPYLENRNDAFGTADCVIVTPDTVHVIDLKMGRGVEVFPEFNEQLMCYALPHSQEDLTCKLHIIQPRLPDQHKSWDISYDDLHLWRVNILEDAIWKIENDDVRFCPGEKQCRWCSFAGQCEALAEYTLEQAGIEFKKFIAEEVPTFNPVEESKGLSKEDISKLMQSFPLLNLWMKKIGEQAFEICKTEGLQGYKIVRGRKNKIWNNAKGAENAILELHEFSHDKLYTEKFLSPAQAQKLVKKIDPNLLNEFITIPQGDPVLAPEGDKRPAIDLSAEKEFKKYVK